MNRFNSNLPGIDGLGDEDPVDVMREDREEASAARHPDVTAVKGA
jgi:hypothetical protein